jgi:hypothetical protein
LDHVENLSANSFDYSSKHHEAIEVGLRVASKTCNQQLAQTESDCPSPEQRICVLLVTKTDRNDEEDGGGTGQRVEKVELCNGDVVDVLESGLHSLSLVQHEIVSEHHHGKQCPKQKLPHFNIESLISPYYS